jgi:very-short-patch-repair endonuclease
MRAKPTHAEDAMWQLLRMNKLGDHFRRQHIIGDYIVDFVCLDKHLIIEVDGGYHFTSEQVQDDAIREAALKRYGFTILRFTNNQVLVEYENVLKCIQNTLASLPSRGSRRGLESVLKAGDISTLSFHATKVYNTIEGGALICHSAEMKYHVDNLKNFGFRGETNVVAPGINSKMDEVRAAYGLLNLRQVDAAIEARKKVAKQYVEALQGVQGIKIFQPMIDAFSPLSGESEGANYSYFPIFVDEEQYGISRDALYEKMKANNVLGRRYFYPLITDFDPYKNIPSANPTNLPVANKIANQVICLPMHHALSAEDVKRVIDCIRK